MSFWHWILWRRQEERELDEEVQFHLAEEARLRSERGQSAESARRDFGKVTRVKEQTRESWGFTAVERAFKDLRYASRLLIKNPAFASVAIAALALGIGATTAIFSVVNSVLLKPLMFPDPDRLVMVWEVLPGTAKTNVVQTQNFLDWRSRNRSFENIAAINPIPMNVAGDGEPTQMNGLRVTAGFFEILGIQPMLGRTIRPEEDRFGVPCVVVLGHPLWQQRFAGRSDAVGQKLMVNGFSCEIVGVMPRGFRFPTVRAELYVPLQINPAFAPREGRNYSTVARLRPNVSLQAADADMRSIAAQTSAERPQFNAKWSATVVPLIEQTVGNARLTLWVLMGAVAFVLLIACLNVSNLLLMRASSRRREMTVRVALGAGRWRLLHQLAIESLLLAVVGGVLGFLLAWFGVPALIGMLPAGFPLPRMQEIAVDRTVLAFTLLLSLACGMFFSLFPALQVDRSRLSEDLRQGGRHGTASGGRLRNVLVVTEVAVAVLLVIGAGLMVRSFIALHSTDPGFRTERLVTFRMLLLPSKYANIERRTAVIQAMLDRIRAVPGVTAASSIHLLPMAGGNSGTGYNRMDRPLPAPGSGTGGDVSVIADNYFQTMGIPLLAGRDFDSRDRIGTPYVAIINQAAAKYLFPGESSLGKRLKVFWFPQTEVEIVGVAADIRHSKLDSLPQPCVFVASMQGASLFASLIVRASGDPRTVISAVKEQMRAVDPDQGVGTIQTMESLVADNIARPRFQTTVLGVFGVVALILACLGIYAVTSYSVVQRTREMGIRLALGAAPRSILRGILGEGMALSGAGIGAGLIGAIILTRFLEKLLYSIRPTDPMVYTAVCAVLIAVALAGCYFPARRATRVDPAVVLREE